MEGNARSSRKLLPHFPPIERNNQSIILYVTQVVGQRRRLLDNPSAFTALLSSWRRADRWQVGRFMVMPDHVHFFCAPAGSPVVALTRWMEFWRAQATRNWPVPCEKPIWQKDFFDRQLRDRESYQQKWEYVRENPVRAGLVTKHEDWPWQGELNMLVWHEPS
jgi:putative transposase